jgi:hypothetical protein
MICSIVCPPEVQVLMDSAAVAMSKQPASGHRQRIASRSSPLCRRYIESWANSCSGDSTKPLLFALLWTLFCAICWPCRGVFAVNYSMDMDVWRYSCQGYFLLSQFQWSLLLLWAATSYVKDWYICLIFLLFILVQFLLFQKFGSMS